MQRSPFAISLNLNVLNHLGINLYSNVAAVLAELVANCWDADAESVQIEVNPADRTIRITDNGKGMTKEELNSKFLNVGYQKRNNPNEATSPKHLRPAMGRKGIGKLSAFSVADVVEVHSVSATDRNAFRMSLQEIKNAISSGSDTTYRPTPIECDPSLEAGTLIVLRDIRKRLTRASEAALRKRLARRFSVIGPAHKFEVKVNGSPISIEDRGYHNKVQYVWIYGDPGYSFSNVSYHESRPNSISRDQETFSVSGWIGTVRHSSDLQDADESINRIVVMSRGKLAQEDILAEFNEGGLYSKYIIGEIHADFLDEDTKEDIATSSRQRLVEDDPRFMALKEFIAKELKHIQNTWSGQRDNAGVARAIESPAIKKWFTRLEGDDRKHARSLFGRINRLPLESETQRNELFKHGVLAFENLRYKRRLSSLKDLDLTNLPLVADVFSSINDIEASLYYQITRERVEVIKALQAHVSKNELEKVIQEHIYKNLWLLDPSWERATEAFMEAQAETAFNRITNTLSPEEKSGRLDIKYCRISGAHVIVELKRADRSLSSYELVQQVAKYRSALLKLLDNSNERVECICLVGKPLKDWSEPNGRKESEEMLRSKSTRVMLYGELLRSAYSQYNEYLAKNKEAGAIVDLLKEIDESSG